MSEEYYKARISELEREVEAATRDCPTWIKSSDRLPKEDQRVIATWQIHKTVHVGIVQYYEGNNFWESVTAWQPLPEPFKLKTTLPQVSK